MRGYQVYSTPGLLRDDPFKVFHLFSMPQPSFEELNTTLRLYINVKETNMRKTFKGTRGKLSKEETWTIQSFSCEWHSSVLYDVNSRLFEPDIRITRALINTLIGSSINQTTSALVSAPTTPMYKEPKNQDTVSSMML